MDLHTRFPPSFDNSPYTYGLALFSLSLISMLSLAQLLGMWFEARRQRELANLVPGFFSFPLPHWSLLNVHRLILGCLYLTVLFGASPDVLVLLLWGEASERTMELLFLLDRLFDTATIVPFLYSAALSAWAAQAIPQKLISEVNVQLAPPQWEMIKGPARIAALVSLISAGVTVGKAGA